MSKNMGMGGGWQEWQSTGMGGGWQECQRTWEWEGGGGSDKEHGNGRGVVGVSKNTGVGGVGEVWAF